MYCLMSEGVETFLHNGTFVTTVCWSQSRVAQEKSSIFAYVNVTYGSYASYCAVICVWLSAPEAVVTRSLIRCLSMLIIN